MWKSLIPLAVACGLLSVSATLAAEPNNAASQAAAPGAERWVSSWATAQELAPPPALNMPPPPMAVIKSMGAMPRPIIPYPNTLADKTVRMIMRTSLGGKAFERARTPAGGHRRGALGHPRPGGERRREL